MWHATFDDHRLPSIDSRKSRIEKSSFDEGSEGKVDSDGYLIEEFADALVAHVPERYRHAMSRSGCWHPAPNRHEEKERRGRDPFD
jgi:hypothetical protein